MSVAESTIVDDTPEHHPARDPALDPAHQHHHAHLHHTDFAEKGREDEVVYSVDIKGPDPSSLEAGYPEKKSKDGSDVEDLGEGHAMRPWQRRVMKQWRHALHIVIWLLFTGCVIKKKRR